MDATQTSILVLFLIGVLGGVAGYWLRIVEKIEDRKDEIYLKNLPSLYYNIHSYIELVENFQGGSQLQTLKTKIKSINSNIAEQAFSGYILLFEPELQKMLSEFYRNSEKFEAILEPIADNDENAGLIKLAFETGQDYRNINLKKLKEEMNNINENIKSKLNRYKTYSYKLMLLISILGGITAIIVYFKG